MASQKVVEVRHVSCTLGIVWLSVRRTHGKGIKVCTGESSVDPTDLSFEWIEGCEYVRQNSEGMQEDQGSTWYT